MTRALDWLRPRPPEPILTVDVHDPAVRGARLDGLLTPTGRDRLGAADLVRGPEGRAASLAGDVPGGAALARLSAVWVHTGCYRPEVHEILVPRGRREHQPRLRVHNQRADPCDTVLLGGVLVTSPTRTAVDLARWTPPGRATVHLRALCAFGLDLAEVEAQLLRRTHEPNTARARDVLAALGRSRP